MQIRRAILLFAIVLGVAAIVSSIARPPDRRADRSGDGTVPATAPSASGTVPGGATPQPTTIAFRSGAKPQTLELEAGRAATVLVDVETPGQVDIPSLGLTQPAEPLTPALFEVLAVEPGRHRIVVQPAASETLPAAVGTLKVVATGSDGSGKRSDRTAGAPANGR